MNYNLQRIAVKGGVLSSLELLQIAEMAEASGRDCLHFGSRQDIILPEGPHVSEALLNQFASLDISSIQHSNRHNVVSSYVSSGIFESTPWLSSSTYLYVLEQLNYQPSLEVNITDPEQQLVALFSGHLNFIASDQEDYWFLYVKLPHWSEMERYPVLIYSWDIGKVAKEIESLAESCSNVTDLFEEINVELDMNSRNIVQPLRVQIRPFPYYEGMNRHGLDRYWLGLYWRNNRYDIKFIKAMCKLAIDQKIAKICLTPWKSFIVKGIPKESKIEWEKLLGQFGINVRHSSLELNWHVPVADEESLALKNYIVQKLNEQDVSTYGLTLGIRKSYGSNFTSIVMQQTSSAIKTDGTRQPSYNLLYSKDFNPNSNKYLTYARDVHPSDLPDLLIELSRMYFDQLGTLDTRLSSGTEDLSTQPKASQKVQHACGACGNIYDSEYGDELVNIDPGIPFDELDEDFECSVCGEAKSGFALVSV